MTETLPRGVHEKLAWFFSHMPDMNNDGHYDSGACANHTWKALGGDKGNPPSWSGRTANETIDKIIASGRYWTPKTWKGDPPAGAILGWKYGLHGHMAIKHVTPGKIATTNPSNGKYTGTEPLTYPTRWGYDASRGPYSVWTDTWNGVRVPVGGNTVSTVTDDFLSLKDTTERTVRTNTDVLLDIKGVTRWQAEKTGGRHTLAMYVNLDLPPSGSEERKAINRGGVRYWFQQVDKTQPDDGRDETGYIGPISPPVYGNQYFLMAHTWPHTVDKDFWEFCFRVYAFDANGKAVDIPLALRTREIKIIGDLTA